MVHVERKAAWSSGAIFWKAADGAAGWGFVCLKLGNIESDIASSIVQALKSWAAEWIMTSSFPEKSPSKCFVKGSNGYDGLSVYLLETWDPKENCDCFNELFCCVVSKKGLNEGLLDNYKLKLRKKWKKTFKKALILHQGSDLGRAIRHVLPLYDPPHNIIWNYRSIGEMPLRPLP